MYILLINWEFWSYYLLWQAFVKVSESFNIIFNELTKAFECKWKFVCLVFTSHFFSQNHLQTYYAITALDLYHFPFISKDFLLWVIACYILLIFFKGVFSCKILALGWEGGRLRGVGTQPRSSNILKLK